MSAIRRFIEEFKMITAKLKRLEVELRRATEEREILKRTAA